MRSRRGAGAPTAHTFREDVRVGWIVGKARDRDDLERTAGALDRGSLGVPGAVRPVLDEQGSHDAPSGPVKSGWGSSIPTAPSLSSILAQSA
jgi:hypothetical protein